jgi:hypothetical protein
VLGGGGIAEHEDSAVDGGGGTTEHEDSAVLGGGGIAEHEDSAVDGGGGINDSIVLIVRLRGQVGKRPIQPVVSSAGSDVSPGGPAITRGTMVVDGTVGLKDVDGTGYDQCG